MASAVTTLVVVAVAVVIPVAAMATVVVAAVAAIIVAVVATVVVVAVVATIVVVAAVATPQALDKALEDSRSLVAVGHDLSSIVRDLSVGCGPTNTLCLRYGSGLHRLCLVPRVFHYEPAPIHHFQADLAALHRVIPAFDAHKVVDLRRLGRNRTVSSGCSAKIHATACSIDSNTNRL